MEYPRELVLDEYTQQRLTSYLDDELFKHYAERTNWLRQLEAYQSSYWAEPVDEPVNFPFSGASNIIVPLNAIAIESVHARTMATMFGMDQFVNCKVTSPEWSGLDRPLELYMDHVLMDDIKAKKYLGDIYLECEKYGTGIGKSGYEKIVKYVVREVNGEREEIPVIVKEGPTIDPVSCGRFLMPFSSQDAQMSPWCGEEHSKTPYEIRVLEESKFFKKGTFDKLKNWVVYSTSLQEGEFRSHQEELEKKEPTWPQLINFVEIWLDFNIDGNENGKMRSIVVHYHRESHTILSIRENWYYDLHRPYRHGVYFPVEHRWAGIGICKQNDQFQEDATIRTRQQIDNATLANMRMVKVSRMSGYGPNEPIFPGKMWILDDMDHVDTFQLGEIYPSSYNTLNQTLTFSNQRTGVTELTLGMPQVGTPGTASEALSRVQEGNKKFGFSFTNMKDLTNELVVDVACNIQQFGPKSIEYLDTMEGGDFVKRYFQLPENFIRDGIIISLRTAGQQENKLLDRQNLIQLAPLYQQYAMGRIQLQQQITAMTQDQQTLLDLINSLSLGSQEIMRQLLETFDMRNVDRILGSSNVLSSGTGSNNQSIEAPGIPNIAGMLTQNQGGFTQ